MTLHAGLPVEGQARKHTCLKKRWSAVIGFLFLGAMLTQAQSTDGWEMFARVKFTEKLFTEQNEYYLVPVLDERIRAHKGQRITLKGHYIPMDLGKNAIVLSKYPYSMCFFCGGAGPESVAEVIFKDKTPRLKPDQLVTITGTLDLNDTDVMHMNFILREAQISQQ